MPRPKDMDEFFDDLDDSLYHMGIKACRDKRPPLETMGPSYMTGYNETKFLLMDCVP